MDNVPDAAAFDALPVGTLLKLDPAFKLPSPLTTAHRVFVQPGEELVTLNGSITGSTGGDAFPTVAHLGFLNLIAEGN